MSELGAKIKALKKDKSEPNIYAELNPLDYLLFWNIYE